MWEKLIPATLQCFVMASSLSIRLGCKKYLVVAGFAPGQFVNLDRWITLAEAPDSRVTEDDSKWIKEQAWRYYNTRRQ
jgi:hypothetical protein